jgi:serine protease Do
LIKYDGQIYSRRCTLKLTRKTILIATVFTVAGIVIGLGISTSFNIQSAAYSQPTISKEAIDTLSKVNQAMAEVAASVKPAVVNISSSSVVTQRMTSPFFDDPFFKRFFGDEFGGNRSGKFRRSGQGSGVIVDKNGYILTNSHVVKDADEIKIKLSDKREFKGKVIGMDPRTDLAIIKIDSNNLPVLKVGDSSQIRVGETVLAIGNPFGLNQTVTSGIVSAVGRADVGIADYEDFIQTDAAINPGNSGGALVNIRGELIGINTAIFSTSGGYQGVGFAVPSNMAKAVMDSLIKSGKVVRGWLGVQIQPVTPDLAKQFNLTDKDGVIIGDVTEDSPAAKAGVQRGDVIVEYSGRKISSPTELRNLVSATAPGQKVSIKIMRDGKQLTLSATVAELPAVMQKSSKSFDNLLNGVQAQELTPELRSRLNIPNRVKGIIVTNVAGGSAADSVIAQGDVIMEINRKKTTSISAYESAVSKIKSGEDILLLIYRNGGTIYITLSNR